MVAFRGKMSTWVPIASADPLAGAGTGTVAVTLGSLALAGAGGIYSNGTLSTTLEAVTLAAQGGAIASATLSTTLADVALVGSGTVANQVFTGTLSVTLDAVIGAASASAWITGTLGLVVGAGGKMSTWTPVAMAKPLAGYGAGAAPCILGPATLLAVGDIGAATGTLDVTLGDVTLAGTANALVSATLDVTLGDVTTATIGNVVSTGTLAATLAPLTLAGAGTPVATGVVTAFLGNVFLAGRGGAVLSPIVWPHDWCPAPGAQRAATLAVDQVNFGDGYQHRATRGLNPVRPTMTLQFPFVGIDRLNAMNAFLKANGARGFWIAPPGSADVMVTADSWSATIVDRNGSDVVGTLQATFAKSFNVQPFG